MINKVGARLVLNEDVFLNQYKVLLRFDVSNCKDYEVRKVV